MRLEKEAKGCPRSRVLLFVNSFYFGGTEGQVVELLRGLPGRYEPRVACLHLQGPHLATVRALGIEPFEVPLHGSLFRPNTAIQVRRLARFLEREQIALVHSQDFYTTLIGVPAARLAGARVLVSRLDMSHWLNAPQRVALALATRAADHVITNAEAIKRQICEQERIAESRVSVIPNGIDLVAFDRRRAESLRAPLPDSEGKIVIVHLANMTHPVKAQEDLFAAFRELLARRSDLMLWLVGDGPRRMQLELLASSLGITPSVHFLGHRPDVPAVLERAHIGVLCSHAEGLSNAIIESMAAWLPMVVTDAGGNRELVRDGDSGFVVPVRSPAQLAAKLGMLVESEPLRARMGAAGRRFVERELGVDKLIARHDTLYRSVLKARAEAA
jgi:glycosyltransferase involved in cell wall biosynthesis